MKAVYQPRKKIVAGSTKRRLVRSSSLNSGDRSAASQSISSCLADPPVVELRSESIPASPLFGFPPADYPVTDSLHLLGLAPCLGGVPEWLNGAVSKTVGVARRSW